MRVSNCLPIAATVCLLAACAADAPVPETSVAAPSDGIYAMSDFATVRKFDAHVHANADSPAFLEQARADGFELLSINVDYPAFPPVAEQHAIALAQAASDPAHFHWATTFPMQGFDGPGWAAATGELLTADVARGARAVKIWKNVGMVEKDADGALVMLDHPGLAPVVASIQSLGVPLIGHQGEPHNCWLPLEQMTTDNDREYFGNHPEYHMYLHPDQPGYEEHMQVRDRFLAAHPQLQALFCATDMLALGALDGLRADNPAASLPAIIGFDDIPQADWQPYQLTTVQQNTALLAHHAVDLLVTRIAKFNLPSRHREVPVKLIVRQSAK